MGENRCPVPPTGWSCTRTAGHEGPCAAIPDDDYVAWLRYSRSSSGNWPTRIIVCDSDAPGAFKVYRHPSNRIAALEAELATCKESLQLAQADSRRLAELHTPRPLDEWHEDIGPVLWFHFPIQEPPYCGTPLDSSWDKYPDEWLTHWTPLPDCNRIHAAMNAESAT